jgi:hypothetical protein
MVACYQLKINWIRASTVCRISGLVVTTTLTATVREAIVNRLFRLLRIGPSLEDTLYASITDSTGDRSLAEGSNEK